VPTKSQVINIIIIIIIINSVQQRQSVVFEERRVLVLWEEGSDIVSTQKEGTVDI
jgi:hypothetical protein